MGLDISFPGFENVYGIPEHAETMALKTTKWVIFAAEWQNQQNDLCAQQRLRSAWASTQSDQCLRCLHEETLALNYRLSMQQTLMRLGRCPCCSEYLLGAHVVLLFAMRWLICSWKPQSEWFLQLNVAGPVVQLAVRLICNLTLDQVPKFEHNFHGDWSLNISVAFLSLPMIQIRQLSVTGESMCT